MMTRLFGGGKGKTPPATNLQNQKTKQIESLRRTGLNAIEVVRDVEYRLTFLSGTTNVTLVVNLPPQFPQEKPVILVQPPLMHPWVDIHMKVNGCANINSFSMHSDLGQAIQIIVEEFKRTPPRILPHMMNQPPMPSYAMGVQPPSSVSMAPDFPRYGVTPAGGYTAAVAPPPIPPRGTMTEIGTGSANTDIENTESQTMGEYTIPDIMKAFPSLKDKGIFELQEIIENEEKILELIQGLPEISKFAQDREDISINCVELARENLAQKPVMEDLKIAVMEKLNILDQLKQEFETHCEKHMSMVEQFHPSNIQTNLKVAVLEAEEEAEKIAEDFLDKKIDIEEFTQKFMQKRTLCHMRRAKEEKLNQIIMASGSGY